ncbi:DENN domain-containing protein 1C [Hondaea fermentalgiana]|uniref:DENN domain-containing protein 1C n=1 Tax=Hondaea fermentalgiana TaxID=2315210 RepID=A0A2R5G8V9_9STRA|nr:DENN domain-containing protein 1C [Hondaea fermentalgiana]|eukprot:GBG26769.1 DENN domain-containing protein 1C [Hondaea fermentalgiana]
MPNAALFVKNYDGHTAAQVASSMRVKSVFNERATTQALECARSNEASLLESLLRMMQDEKALTKTLLSQLLHAASGAGASAVVQHLIDAHHVDVDSTLRAGRSALHYAVANSQYEIIRILLERGASTEIVDMHGQKPADASTDRISQRIIRRVESMRVKKRKQSAPHLLGSSSVPAVATVAPTGMDRNAIDGDYFGVSKVVMDSLVVFGFALDPDQLVTNQLSDNGNLIAALPATAADDETTMRLTLFCREALEAFLANANKGVFHMHNEKENDGSLAQHGSFVFLRKSTKESLASDSAKKSASTNSDLFTNNLELELDPDHCMGAPQPAPLSVHALRDNSFGLSSLDAIAVEDDDDDLSTDSDTEVDSLSFAQRRRQDVADYYQINVNYFKPAFFPFVVTDDKGERSFCSIMCFAQVAHDKASLEARCVCLLSKLPLFTIHRRLLFDMFAVGMGHLELTRDTSQNLCARDVAASIVGKEIGQPGESPGLNIDVGTRIVTFTTPPSLSLPVVDDMCFDALMACLKPRNIAALFAALLTEQSVLLVSEHPHLLTVASHALLALLFPFSWVHCFIPILPRQAIDLIQAPFPFLLGIHSSHLEHVPGERLASLIVVNLDRDSVVVPIADISSSADASMPPLPWSHRQIIEHALAEARPQQRVQTATVGEMASFIGSPGRSFSQPKTPKDSSKLGSWSHTAARNSLPSSFHEAWGKPDTLAKRSMATAASAYVMSTQEMKRKKEMETKKSPAQDYHVKTENIAKVRAACLEVIISLVGDFGKVHFAEEAKPEVLRTTRDPELRAFLEALLASQSWSVFANEMNTEVSSERREVELALFNTLMDNQLQHERMHVQAPRLLVHVHQDSASPVECTIRCGERLTIIDKRSSSSSSSLSSKQQQIWFRFREYRGWCLATPSDFRELSADQDRYKPLEATALHFGNESLYPAYHHSRVQGINYDPLFQTVHFVRFDDSFPSLQEEDE